MRSLRRLVISAVFGSFWLAPAVGSAPLEPNGGGRVRVERSAPRSVACQANTYQAPSRHGVIPRARSQAALNPPDALTRVRILEHRLHELIVAGALFFFAIGAALLWAFVRIRRVNERLRFNSEHDALTGLWNRRYFNERMQRGETDSPAGGCVLLADLDYFKRVNDTLGHPAGDAVLAVVSRRLSGVLRDRDKLVRWGGEEFLVVLADVTPREADVVVQRLLQAVRGEPVMWSGHAIECTISIGYACFPAEPRQSGSARADIGLDKAIDLVDAALYEAKRSGRDRACLIRAGNVGSESRAALMAKSESATRRLPSNHDSGNA